MVRYLTAQGIDAARFAAVGYGETHPVYPNDTEAHRQKNRRVDIVFVEGNGLPVSPGDAPETIRNEIHHAIHGRFNRVWNAVRNEGNNP